MDMSNSNLYTYENDYKEQHAKHIKRPALVTIKKPLISKGEMEDVLLRLLNLHAKPTRQNFNPKGVQRGINGKAILVDYHKTIAREHSATDDATDLEYQIRNVFEISTKESVYLWDDPFNITGTNANPFDSTANITPDRVSALRNTQGKYGRAKTYGDAGFTIHVSHSPQFDSLNGWYDPEQTNSVLKKAVDTPASVKYSLYLLTKDDHLYLKPHPKTGVSQLKSLIQKSFLFTAHGFPTYVGTHVVFDPKDKNGVEHPLDAKMAKRVFGYIPKAAVNAYEWVFYTRPLTHVSLDKPVWKKTEENAVRVYVRFVTQLQKLFTALDTPEQVSEKIKAINVKTTYKNAYNKVQKILNEALKSGENYTLTSFGILSRINKAVQVIKELEIPADVYGIYYSRTPVLGTLAPSIKSLTSGIKKVKTIPEQMIHVIDNMNAYVDESGERSGYVSMLDTNERRAARAADEAKRNQVSNVFLTTKSSSNITLGKFKEQYYAILINKINQKYKELKHFLDNGIVYFPLQEDLDAVNAYLDSYAEYGIITEEVTLSDTGDVIETPTRITDYDFINRAERLLFSSFSGFYVTSYMEDSSEVKAPIWNSLADLNTLSGKIGTVEYGDYGKYHLINVQNKDISSLSISRSVIGKATAQFIIKNANKKYNYSRADVLNRGKYLIEPMDEVMVFLPTLEFTKSGGIQNYSGKLEQVFSGVVNSCVNENNAGYNSLRVSCECNKKYMDVVRTNIKPSACREESSNNPVTAFIVPNHMYESVENWMPYMFAQALSFIHCQPIKTTEADLAKPLFTVTKAPVIAEQEFRVNEVGSVDISYTDDVEIPSYYKITKTYLPTALEPGYDSFKPVTSSDVEVTEAEYEAHAGESSIVPLSGGKSVIYEKRTKTVPRKFTYTTTGITKEFITRKATVGYMDSVSFSDPLFTYLWYKSNSYQLPEQELKIIQNNLTSVLQDYVASIVYDKNAQTENEPDPKKEIVDLRKELASGGRVAYIVYKQRFSGTTLSAIKEDRAVVGRITGTSQPAYLLQSQQIPLQLSNWKTNGTLINETASRFNFIYYTDRFGTINFSPYSLDLTTLNTVNYKESSINTDKMLITRSSRDLENEDNPQVLKQQYLINFSSNIQDQMIINWLDVNGQFQVSPGSSKFLRALVTDPVLIKKFGYRTGKSISIFGIDNEETLRLYGLAYMDRFNRKYRSANVSGIFDSRMDINLPYYVPMDETIYYCESLTISYNAGETCRFNMSLTFGKKPLLSVEDYSVEGTKNKTKVLSGSYLLDPNIVSKNTQKTLTDALSNLFIHDNSITPTTYLQYKQLFNGVKEENEENEDITRKASLCCYNGYLWDNVSGISFEELVYNYPFNYYGIRTSGLTASLVAFGKSEWMEKLSSIIKPKTDNINLSAEEKNALRMYYIDLPAIKDPNSLPDVFNKATDVIQDLNVPGLLDVDFINSENNRATGITVK